MKATRSWCVLAQGLVLVFGFACLCCAAANAGPIQGFSTGTLDCTTGCQQIDDFRISWQGTNGQVSYLKTGYPNSDGNYAIDQDFASLGGANVRLGTILWQNRDQLNGTVAAAWYLNVTLTDPLGGYSFDSNLNITLKKKGEADDILVLSDLSGLNFTIDGWKVDNFHYVLNDHNDRGRIKGNTWTTDKNDTSRLWLVADFTRVIVLDFTTAQVPEPAFIMLLGFGIGAVSLSAWRLK